MAHAMSVRSLTAKAAHFAYTPECNFIFLTFWRDRTAVLTVWPVTKYASAAKIAE